MTDMDSTKRHFFGIKAVTKPSITGAQCQYCCDKPLTQRGGSCRAALPPRSALGGRQDCRRRLRRSGIGLPSETNDSRRYFLAVTSETFSVLASSSSDWPLSNAARAAATFASLIACRAGTGNPSCRKAQARALSIVGVEQANLLESFSFDQPASHKAQASRPNVFTSNLGGRFPPGRNLTSSFAPGCVAK